jgi:hypothetical protein
MPARTRTWLSAVLAVGVAQAGEAASGAPIVFRFEGTVESVFAPAEALEAFAELGVAAGTAFSGTLTSWTSAR